MNMKGIDVIMGKVYEEPKMEITNFHVEENLMNLQVQPYNTDVDGGILGGSFVGTETEE